jgi:Flp pilus assembly protein TadG
MRQILQTFVPPRLRGSVAIEFGFVLPVLLLFTLGIIDFGRYLWTNITLNRAAESAARCGAVNNTTVCPDISAYAKSEAWGLAAGDVTVTVNAAAACGMQVQTSYAFQFIIPWFPDFGGSAPLGTQTLTATACYPTQF